MPQLAHELHRQPVPKGHVLVGKVPVLQLLAHQFGVALGDVSDCIIARLADVFTLAIFEFRK